MATKKKTQVKVRISIDTVFVKDRLWVISARDEEDSHLQLDDDEAAPVLGAYLQEELQAHPRTQVTVFVRDENGEPFAFQLQRFD